MSEKVETTKTQVTSKNITKQQTGTSERPTLSATNTRAMISTGTTPLFQAGILWCIAILRQPVVLGFRICFDNENFYFDINYWRIQQNFHFFKKQKPTKTPWARTTFRRCRNAVYPTATVRFRGGLFKLFFRFIFIFSIHHFCFQKMFFTKFFF